MARRLAKLQDGSARLAADIADLKGLLGAPLNDDLGWAVPIVLAMSDLWRTPLTRVSAEKLARQALALLPQHRRDAFLTFSDPSAIQDFARAVDQLRDAMRAS